MHFKLKKLNLENAEKGMLFKKCPCKLTFVSIFEKFVLKFFVWLLILHLSSLYVQLEYFTCRVHTSGCITLISIWNFIVVEIQKMTKNVFTL